MCLTGRKMMGVLVSEKLHTCVARLITFTMLCAAPGLGLSQMITTDDLIPAAEQGFGDRSNSYPWSVQWFKGKLYVGTGRDFYCVQQATIARWIPSLSFLYPPADPVFACTPNPQDLPLQAEIWAWTPDTDTWERVYQSPADVPKPGNPSELMARDTAYRTMAVFTEADGTEALYVGAVSSESFNPGVPPARILRTTDGLAFEAVPQDPGTLLGDLIINGFPGNGFRSMTVHDGRLYTVASEGFLGFGRLLDAANPAGGNDAWRFAMAEGFDMFDMASYNGSLYLGLANEDFFSVVKLDTSGDPPYSFTTVIPEGGYNPNQKSQSVVSMYVSGGMLYVGTDRPAEMYRVHPDDSWELIVGAPRFTPVGMKRPLSGMNTGFDNNFNLHVWRMQEAFGVLHVSTFDQTTKWLAGAPTLAPVAGFDLYGTTDGWNYTQITRSAMGDPRDQGVRNFSLTPYGLFIGASNIHDGLNLWRATPDPARLTPPQQFEADQLSGYVTLSWEGVPSAAVYHIYRSRLNTEAAEYEQIATTGDTVFVDLGFVNPQQPHHYYVVAETASSELSGPSNIANVPDLGPHVTLFSLRTALRDWGADPTLRASLDALIPLIFFFSDYETAVDQLLVMRAAVAGNPNLLNPSWRANDVVIMISRLARTVGLVHQSYLPFYKLF